MRQALTSRNAGRHVARLDRQSTAAALPAPCSRSTASWSPQVAPATHQAQPQQHDAAPAPSGRSASHVVYFAPAQQEAAEGAAVGTPNLADMTMYPVVDTQGLILSDPCWNSKAYVFAIFDEFQKLQYIGFSRDLKNSLRTLFSRRPEKTYYFKAHGLSAVDQDAMMAVRTAWFAEVGGPPSGNKLQLERTMWQQAIDAGAISQRGKQAAAEEKTKQVLEALRQRGCKEDFVPNPTLMAEGLVDFLACRSLSIEEMEGQRAEREAAVRAVRNATAVIDGIERKYQVCYKMKAATNGGHMLDFTVTLDGRETKHRVVVGRDYYEPHGVGPEVVVEAAMSLLLSLKVSRQTEGVLLSSQYPINYFSISQVEQWFRGDFRAELAKVIGKEAFDATRDTDFWRFNRVFDYGAMKLEDAWDMNVALNAPLQETPQGLMLSDGSRQVNK